VKLLSCLEKRNLDDCPIPLIFSIEKWRSGFLDEERTSSSHFCADGISRLMLSFSSLEDI